MMALELELPKATSSYQASACDGLNKIIRVKMTQYIYIYIWQHIITVNDPWKKEKERLKKKQPGTRWSYDLEQILRASCFSALTFQG